MAARHYTKKTFLVCTLIATFLQWIIYQLLVRAKLGLPAECFSLAQVCVILVVSPYLAACAARFGYRAVSSIQLLALSPNSAKHRLLKTLIISQLPILGWALLSTGFILVTADMSFVQALKMLAVLAIYSFSAGAVGLWGAQVFRDILFGAELAYILWCFLVGSMFLLTPLERHIDNIQPLVPIVLHANPLIAVCSIFEGWNIFRTPLLYELTLIPSYDFTYPAWYVIGFLQLLIGGSCLLGTARISSSLSTLTLNL